MTDAADSRPTPPSAEPSPIDLQVRSHVGLITEDEMARILQLQSIDTLATWRSQKRGPNFVKLGKKVFYTVSDFGHWVADEAKRQRPAPRSAPADLPRDIADMLLKTAQMQS